MATERVLIPDRGEFIDALRMLRRGAVIARSPSEQCLLGGLPLPSAFEPLSEFQLLDEVQPPDEPTPIRFYRLNRRGREFADRAVAEWRSRPLLQRLAARIVG